MQRFPINHSVVLETNSVLKNGETTYNAAFIISHERGTANVQPDITSDEARDMTQAKAEDLFKKYEDDINSETPGYKAETKEDAADVEDDSDEDEDEDSEDDDAE